MNTAEGHERDITALEEWMVVSVENLQRSLARTRLALTVVTLALLAWVAGPFAMGAARNAGILPAQTVPEVVRARQFVLTDANDHVRGTWGVDESGVSRIQLRDPSGVARLRLSVLETGSPGMSFSDELGQSRVVLGLLPDQSSSLVLADPTGATRVVLGLAHDKSATLVFADPTGQTRAGLGVEPDGSPTFMFSDDQAPASPAAGGTGGF